MRSLESREFSDSLAVTGMLKRIFDLRGDCVSSEVQVRQMSWPVKVMITEGRFDREQDVFRRFDRRQSKCIGR